MRRELVVVFVAAVALYLPTANYGFVQDDRAIIASNPAAHSIGAALGALGEPYWPRGSGAGLYRPMTILSYAIDWTIGGGRPGWFHIMNALWHGLATVFFVLVVGRWLPPVAAAGAGLLFAWHPVHVEAVASLVGRAELLAAVGILGAVVAARRGWWLGAILGAALAMFSKEHGVIAGVVILLDKWLHDGTSDERRYPVAFWVGLAALTAAFLLAWSVIGRSGASDVAAVFLGTGPFTRLAVALPAVARASALLVWPVSLSSDYGPQVVPARTAVSVSAMVGFIVVVLVPTLLIWSRRRAPAVSLAAGLAALSYLPTANLLFPSGVVLAERNLYLAVALPATIVGTGLARIHAPRAFRAALALLGMLTIVSAWRSIDRLPAWRDNRSLLLTLLADHPESYRAHASAAAVLAGLGDTAGARREYRIADSIFPADPYLVSARAIFLLDLGDTSGAAPLISRVDRGPPSPADRLRLRARFLWQVRRGDRLGAMAVADTARRRFPDDSAWYQRYLR